MSKIRAYYLLEFQLESPLSIGAADSVKTDHDVVLDSRGLPVIPGTSLAGVYRSYFDKKTAGRYFGNRANGDSGKLDESRVRVFDAVWIGGNDAVSVRDSVSLENKVAKTGLKFDRQIVERGARFRTYIELLQAGESECSDFEGMFAAIDSGKLRFGSKTTRGFGRVVVGSCLKMVFDLAIPEQREAWLDFRMFDRSGWDAFGCDDLTERIKAGGVVCPSGQLHFVLDLKQRGPLSIREYCTEPGRPDFGQLHIRDANHDGVGVPVIPGTSWAGAFRERYEAFAGTERTNELFGFVKPGSEGNGATMTARSRITFSESVVGDGEWKEITRNAIDRFTGGTREGSLFTLRTYYCGTTSLELHMDVGTAYSSKEELMPLLAVLSDLHNGFMAIGGLTAVGHGRFSIEDARLEIGSKSYIGFADDLLGFAVGGYVQPDIEVIAERIGALVDGSKPGGDNRD